jgi:quercetin dioxygenase-like cupin family protein
MIQQSTNPQVNPSDETIRVAALEIRFLVTGADSSGSAAVFEMTVPVGDKLPAPPHSHDAYEETVFGIEGTLTWTVDDEAVEVGLGQALCITRGAVHQFANHGSEDAKALVIITPAAIGPEYFRETAEVLTATGGGPPDRAKLMAIMHRHGLTPALPPTA